MTIQQHASFDSSAAELNATSKLVKAWETKNAKNAAKAGGITLMALSLAACGGSSETVDLTPFDQADIDAAVSTVKVELTAVNDELTAVNLEFETANGELKTINVELAADLDDAEDAVALLQAAIDDYEVEDLATQEAIEALGVDSTLELDEVLAAIAALNDNGSFADGAASRDDEVTVLSDAVIDADASIADLTSDLADATSDLADATSDLADATSDLADADASIVDLTDDLADADASIAELTEAASDSAAAAARLDLLTLSAPTETVTVTDGNDVSFAVEGLTAYGDNQTVTLISDGTGTITFNFVDSDDTLTLTGASDITGYTVMNIVGGTVDVTAIDTSNLTSINIASGATMSAPQFLALDEVNINDADGSLVIEVSDDAEADEVTAALSKVGGPDGGADTISLALTEDSDLDADDLAALNDAADDAANENNAAGELPGLLEALAVAAANVDAADDALDGFLEDFGDANDVDDADADDVADASDDAIDAVDVIVADAVDGADFTDATQAVQDSLITVTASGLGAAVTGADGLVDVAEAALLEDVVGLISAADVSNTEYWTTDAALDAADAAVNLDLVQMDALADALDGGAFIALDDADGELAYVGDILDVDGDAIADADAVIANFDDDSGAWELNDADDMADAVDDADADMDAFFDLLETLGVDELLGLLDAQANAVVAEDAAYDAASDAVADALNAQADDVDAVDSLDAGDALDADGVVWDDADALADDADALAAADDILDYIDASVDAEDAAAAVTQFNDAVDAMNTTGTLVDEMDALDGDIGEAIDARDDAADDFADFGLTLDTDDFSGTLDATDGSDVFIFSSDVGDAVLMDGFGEDGVDYLALGDDYTFVALGEDEAITDRVGSAEELEIFYSEADGTLSLFVEDGAESGRDTNGDDITAIILDGLEFSDLDISGDILSATDIVV
jgi:predicted  nucleic acid-binding Zn-ribbon protein